MLNFSRALEEMLDSKLILDLKIDLLLILSGHPFVVIVSASDTEATFVRLSAFHGNSVSIE